MSASQEALFPPPVAEGDRQQLVRDGKSLSRSGQFRVFLFLEHNTVEDSNRKCRQVTNSNIYQGGRTEIEDKKLDKVMGSYKSITKDGNSCMTMTQVPQIRHRHL